MKGVLVTVLAPHFPRSVCTLLKTPERGELLMYYKATRRIQCYQAKQDGRVRHRII